ncbi:hypothetical protein [Compostibacter hankyongensis]|uniref:ABC transporter ATPase n=1 Tax=Compostibacter hankyongensis TaxID=1007089 RepID=A0ABP8FVR6_9BACT
MNQDITALLPQDFHPASRVWIYQSNRPFNAQEEKEINEQLLHFTAQWNAHGDSVKGWGKLLFGRFIILMADESRTGVSGCSTDSSVRLIKSIARQYEAALFDRLLIAFWVKEQIEMLPLSQVAYAFSRGFIDENTLFFNNTVLSKQELESRWLVPVKDSWLASRLQEPAALGTAS